MRTPDRDSDRLLNHNSCLKVNANDRKPFDKRSTISLWFAQVKAKFELVLFQKTFWLLQRNRYNQPVLRKISQKRLDIMTDNFVIVPTYNEADNLDDLISQLLALPVPIGVIVVDDNSPDGTGQLADEWAARHPGQVLVVHRPGKLGLGTAYIAGFKKAMSIGARRIMTMDADFSHNPRYIPDMIALSKQKHVVIGSRYVPGGGQKNCTWKRVLLSKGGNFVARTLLGLQARDATAGFRLYRREVLETIPLNQIFSSGYSFLVEMLFLCQRRGWQVGEVPIIFEDRRKGKTKISRNEVIKAQYTLLRLFFRRLRGGEPRRPEVPISSS